MSNENITFINSILTENEQKFNSPTDIDWLRPQIYTLSGDRLAKLSNLLKDVVNLKASDWDSNNLYISMPSILMFLFRLSDEQLNQIYHAFSSFNVKEKYYFLAMTFNPIILDTAGTNNQCVFVNNAHDDKEIQDQIMASGHSAFVVLLIDLKNNQSSFVINTSKVMSFVKLETNSLLKVGVAFKDFITPLAENYLKSNDCKLHISRAIQAHHENNPKARVIHTIFKVIWYLGLGVFGFWAVKWGTSQFGTMGQVGLGVLAILLSKNRTLSGRVLMLSIIIGLALTLAGIKYLQF